MKLIAFILIIASSSGFGFLIAYSFKARICFLEKLLIALDVIASELKYGKATLLKLLSNINKNKIISEMGYFKDIENNLKIGKLPKDAFDIAKKIAFDKYSLKNEDNDILEQIPMIFQNENSTTAIIAIEKLTYSISSTLCNLKEKYKSKSKLSKGLGILSGIFIVIIFI